MCMYAHVITMVKGELVHHHPRPKTTSAHSLRKEGAQIGGQQYCPEEATQTMLHLSLRRLSLSITF